MGIRKKVCFVIVVVTVCVPAITLIEYATAHKLKALAGFGYAVAIAGFATAFVLVPMILNLMEFERLTFGQAIRNLLAGWLAFLCFLPFIGDPISRYLERRREGNPFTRRED